MSARITTSAFRATRAAALSASAVAVTAALLAGGGTAAAKPPVPPPPAPFSATVSHDKNCLFTATASWTDSSVNRVWASWYLDGQFLLTSPDATTSPATFLAGPFVKVRGAAHDWQVRIDFYAGEVAVTQVWSNIDSARCAVTA
jgi:hypothetical protein